MRKTRKEPFESWLKRSLREDPALAARVEKRLAEMRIEQDLIALRQSRGLTQAQLARMLGVSQPAVAKMEAQGGNLEIRTLARAAEVLDARLEIRLIAGPHGSSSRTARAYVSGSSAPSFVHDSKTRYASVPRARPTRRKKPSRTASRRKERWGLQAREREKKEFLELADRLARSSDASERARLKEELARRTFGE
jgi:transcriptional regulator with XRE-family HTH domain